MEFYDLVLEAFIFKDNFMDILVDKEKWEKYLAFVNCSNPERLKTIDSSNINDIKLDIENFLSMNKLDEIKKIVDTGLTKEESTYNSIIRILKARKYSSLDSIHGVKISMQIRNLYLIGYIKFENNYLVCEKDTAYIQKITNFVEKRKEEIQKELKSVLEDNN